MKGFGRPTKPALRLVHVDDVPVQWLWFCGHCAAPSPGGQAPVPAARVCSACGLGLLLEARSDAVPGADDAFVVVDAALTVQAVSRHAEQLLALGEDVAVNRPVAELLVPADAELRGRASFAATIAEAIVSDTEPRHAFVRPWNTFGVRLRARVGACGPPRAALVVLESSGPRNLRTIPAE